MDSQDIQIGQVEGVSLDQHGWKQLDHSLLFMCSFSIYNFFSSYLTAYLAAYQTAITGINCSNPNSAVFACNHMMQFEHQYLKSDLAHSSQKCFNLKLFQSVLELLSKSASS